MNRIQTINTGSVILGMTLVGAALVVALALMLSLPWSAVSPARADDSPPSKPAGLSVSAQPGSLSVSVDWDDITSATHYSVRWRESGPGNPLSEAVETQSSDANITVGDYGRWVVRVEACNDAGCGLGKSKGFEVRRPKPTPEPTPVPTPEPTPVPTPEPTPVPTPEPTPVPTPEPTPVPTPESKITRPAQPAGLSASPQADSLDVAVDWDDTTGADSYLVRWRIAGAGNSLTEGIEAESSAADITVADYGKWVVRVEACNSAGCGLGKSKGFEVRRPKPTPEPTPIPTPEPTPIPTPEPTPVPTPESKITRPARPAGLSASPQVGSLDVAVDWDDTTGADSYLVRWRIAGAGNSLTEGIEAESSDADITVADYGKWVVRVEACNSAGCGPGKSKEFEIESPEPTFEVIPQPAEAHPEPPLALAAEQLTSGEEVTLTWSAPEDDGGYPITGYGISRSHWDRDTDGHLDRIHEVVIEDTGSTSTTYLDSTAEERTSYDYRIWAINSAGAGSVASVSITTARQTDGVPYSPVDLSAVEHTAGEVTLTWSAPEDDGGYPITGHRIIRSHYDRGPDGRLDRIHEVLSEDTGSTSTTYVDSTVEERTTYDYRVRAINSAGAGSISASVSIATVRQTYGVPYSPADLNAVEHTVGEVTLTWSAPQDDGGYPITGHRIIRSHYDRGSDGRLDRIHEVLSEDTGSTSTTYVDSTVKERTVYDYRVRAINSAGAGSISASVSIATARQTDGVPYAPVDLNAVEHTAGEVTLTWSAPEDDGGYPITGHRIIRSHYDRGPDGRLDRIHEVLSEDTGSTSTTYVDSTVKERTTYDYRVRAINSAGAGNISASVSILTERQGDGTPGSPGVED